MRKTDPVERDADLMRRVARGDGSASRLLAREHLDGAYRQALSLLGNRSDAEDTAQEAFLRLWKAAPDWQPQARIKTWLYRVVYNLCMDRLRQSKRFSSAEIPEQADPAPSMFELRERQQMHDSLTHSLQQLPARQQAAIRLVHLEECSGREAAGILDISTDALESLLARGRRKLRDLLQTAENRKGGRK
ncbi:sigma-70 family RNA polymerase sigma factor [Sneathiella chinensis]|uniref:DNA-directed RNA polymerase sigma-70 factor n=1 Tax=Sneathiella chinensis TaxID=349750 RepID=A0ABQ5TZS6_9PROT|nr:sigma-70 family RNA polymerase sigma factor [Sneathiella chinensis]GLQ05370.1 DNA-directed RNA polymerase sigma-70 factor [Sneathiella chinensis]